MLGGAPSPRHWDSERAVLAVGWNWKRRRAGGPQRDRRPAARPQQRRKMASVRAAAGGAVGCAGQVTRSGARTKPVASRCPAPRRDAPGRPRARRAPRRSGPVSTACASESSRPFVLVTRYIKAHHSTFQTAPCLGHTIRPHITLTQIHKTQTGWGRLSELGPMPGAGVEAVRILATA